MRWIAVLLLAITGCASTQKGIEEMAKGSCQAECKEQHPDSLYDENRCLEQCEPPK